MSRLSGLRIREGVVMSFAGDVWALTATAAVIEQEPGRFVLYEGQPVRECWSVNNLLPNPFDNLDTPIPLAALLLRDEFDLRGAPVAPDPVALGARGWSLVPVQAPQAPDLPLLSLRYGTAAYGLWLSPERAWRYVARVEGDWQENAAQIAADQAEDAAIAARYPDPCSIPGGAYPPDEFGADWHVPYNRAEEIGFPDRRHL